MLRVPRVNSILHNQPLLGISLQIQILCDENIRDDPCTLVNDLKCFV